MDFIVIIITIILVILGLGIFIWSIISTRNKFYNEYIGRMKDGKN